MLLFKEWHIEPILKGTKTETRRQWKKCRVKVGSIHKCKTEIFTKKYFARVKILKTFQQKLRCMVMEDYSHEGGYTKEEFIDGWRAINGIYDKEETVWVVKFERIKDASENNKGKKILV